MKYTKSSVYCLLFALSAVPVASMAAIRVGNLSRNNADAYQQVNNTRYQNVAPVAPVQQVAAATPQGVVSVTPAPVVNTQAETEQVDACTLIYPDGEFERARPTSGVGAGGAETCTAVVEMRAIGAGQGGSDAVLLRANLAAGESFRCNIGDFHESTYLPAAGEITFPGDQEPSMQDVINVMNQEQKQNAAMKIISTAVVGALGGNIAGANEPGQDSLLGGGKDKIKGTVIGALGGAALGAGGAYSGKVAGDMIMSAGINAAAGSVVGNISATGKSVLRIEDCEIDGRQTKCLWGILEQKSDLGGGTAYVSAKTGTRSFRLCTEEKCEIVDLTDIKVPGYDNQKSTTKTQNKSTGQNTTTKQLTQMQQEEFVLTPAEHKFCLVNGKMQPLEVGNCTDGPWIKLLSASKVSKRVPAMLVDVEDKAFGWKQEDWLDKFVPLYGNNKIVGRVGAGVASNLPADSKPEITNFTPVYLDSEDGGVIDMDNKARLGGTLTGAGVGGAAGAFSAYQGAQSEIEMRWVTAVREYKDSLQKVYCVTGKRFVGYYNDTIIIPAPTE